MIIYWQCVYNIHVCCVCVLRRPNVIHFTVLQSSKTKSIFHALIFCTCVCVCVCMCVQVPPLSQEECPALLQHWLSSAGRSLLPVQAEAVLAAFQRCPLPLYLRLVMREVLSWSSYHLPQWRRTPGHTITGVLLMPIRNLIQCRSI